LNQKEIKELIDYLIEKDIAEFELERGDVKLRMKRATEAPPVSYVQAPPTAHSAPATHAPHLIAHSAAGAGAPTAPGAAEEEEDLFIVKSPIVGTFYEAPSPGSPPFVNVGDKVQVGQVLCIIEAMKLMNEIESDAAGEIVKRMVSNGQPVEYGQGLFAIRQH
jgi:acetyl-CoA carboxylase biotin carboxyl carrier protein